MRKVITFILCFVCFAAFAQQPTGDIEKDTIAANQYFEQAKAIQGNNKKKVALLEQAIALYEAHPFMPKLIDLKGHLGHTLEVIGDMKGREIAIATLALAEKHQIDTLSPSLTYTYMLLLFHYQVTDMQKALHFGQRALQLVKKPSVDYFQVVDFLITIYGYTQNKRALNETITTLETYLKASNKKEDQVGWLSFYYGKMHYAILTSNLETYTIYTLQLLKENEQHKVYGDGFISTTYMELGMIYSRLNKFEEALTYMDKALENIKTLDTFSLITLYTNAAQIYYHKKDYQAGLSYLNKGIAIAQPEEKFKMPLTIIYNNMGAFYSALEQPDKEMAAREKGLSYAKAPTSYSEYALQLIDKQQYDKAIDYAQKSMQMEYPTINLANIKDNPPIDKISVSIILINNLKVKTNAFYYKSLVDKENRVELETLSVTTGDLLVETIYKHLVTYHENSQMYAPITKIGIESMGLLIELYYKKYKETNEDIHLQKAFSYMEKRKSLQLLKSLTISPLPKNAIEEEKTIKRKRDFYQRKMDLVTKDSLKYYQNKLLETSLALEDFMEQNRKNYPKEVANFYNIDYATSSDIQEKLDKNTLWVEYSISGENLFIYTIDNKVKSIHKVPLEESFFVALNTVSKLLKDRFLTQQKKRTAFIDASHLLYQTLITPIKTAINDKTKIVIVPTDDLFYIPFEVLLSSNEHKDFHALPFLIKEVEISYHYSATVYKLIQEKAAIKNHNLLAFAPVFDESMTLGIADRSMNFMVDSLYRSVDNNSFVFLPNSKKEVETIGKLVKTKGKGQSTLLLEEEATKANLNAKLALPYQFIHIATHGLVNHKNPRLSALACHGVNDQIEQTLYFANEVQFKNIQADLVVLSSCESGIGKSIGGEGLIALNRSFIYAGARNVLFSLWKVNDQYSSELMIDFYKAYLKDGTTYTSALRTAKLKMLKNPTTALPRFWAAFVLMGE